MRIKYPKKGYKKLTEAKARIIAHVIGDGNICLSKHDYSIKYEVADRELLNSFEEDMVNTYGLKLSHYSKASGKTGKLIPYVRLRSKIVYHDLLRYAEYYSYTWYVKNPILNASKAIKAEFLKALFDDEGSVIPQGKKAIVRLYSVNPIGLFQIRLLLSEFKIASYMVNGFGEKRNVKAIVIQNIEQFSKQIGFNLRRKQEGLSRFIN